MDRSCSDKYSFRFHVKAIILIQQNNFDWKPFLSKIIMPKTYKVSPPPHTHNLMGKEKKLLFFFLKHFHFFTAEVVWKQRQNIFFFSKSLAKKWKSLLKFPIFEFLPSKSNFFEQSEAKGRAELGIGLAKKKWTKKKRYHDDDDSTSTNFVPGQTIHFLVEVFAFLSLFQPLKTFSYVFLQSIQKTFWENNFRKKFFWKKKKNQKKLFIFFFRIFFFRFFFSLSQHLSLSILL